MRKVQTLTHLQFVETLLSDIAVNPKIDVTFMERECQKILRGNSFKATVKIFTRLDPFLERLDSMNAHKESLEEGIKFRPDEKYPELSRNELIKHTILAICL